jgi:hypothetical protein
MKSDFISREEAVRAVSEAVGKMVGVEVAPIVHARWVFNKEGRLCCSNCETVPSNKIDLGAATAYFIQNIKGYMAYCPKCGAQMNADEEET